MGGISGSNHQNRSWDRFGSGDPLRLRLIASVRQFTPLFAISVLFYGINRTYLNIADHAAPFLRFHFNDLLTVPVMFPILICIQRLAGARPLHDDPRIPEVLLWCAGWSILFEMVFPVFAPAWATGDPVDVLCYFLGTALYVMVDFHLMWNVKPRELLDRTRHALQR